MSIELTPASTEEIAAFKQAAAARYKERGIHPKLASAAFNRYMAKMAGTLGVAAPPPARIQKLAEQLKPVVAKLQAVKVAKPTKEAAKKQG